MPDSPPAEPTAIVPLLCKRRACRTLLARVVGVTLVCLDGTRVGPVEKGMIISRKCPRCGANNVKWL